MRKILQLVSFLCLAISLVCCEETKKAPPAPPLVEVSQVIQKDVPLSSEFIGTVEGMVSAAIRAQVQGYLISQDYKEGQMVKSGEALFHIDPAPFQAALDKANAEQARAEAQHVAAQANMRKIEPLAKTGAASMRDLDNAIGMVQSTEASIGSAKASVEKAKLDLAFTKVVSPVDGMAGLAKAQVGDLVGTVGGSELTTVATIDPVRVTMPLSEQDYLRLTYGKTPEERKTKAQNLEAEMVLADGTVYPEKGKIAFTDSRFNQETGTIRVVFSFPNPDRLLRPGLFAKIRFVLEEKRGALLIPHRALSEVQGRYLVAVVGQDNVVSMRPVKIGQCLKDGTCIVEDGLKAGESVVAEGIQKVRDGTKVNPQPFGSKAA